MGERNLLESTIPMMTSSNYKERFIAEYRQLTIRIDKLDNMLHLWQIGQLDFLPTCPYELLAAQLHAMQTYRLLLMRRADIEDIDLTEEG